jgi:uncharacterized protein (DUF58 family)
MTATSRAGGLRFLDPAVIARLGTLELRARTIVEGFLSGLHRSPMKGFSVEFAEYRQYMPGDDLSTIDWKVFGRTDRFVVRKHEEETNLKGFLILDVSASMSYGSGDLSKIEYASTLTASLAYLMQKQRDAAGLVTFDDRIRQLLPPATRPGHLNALLHALTQAAPGAATDTRRPLAQVADAMTSRGLVVVLSDLLDDPAHVIAGLRLLRARGSDVLVFHVLDRDELTFPFDRPMRFRDLEDGAEILATPRDVREGYLRAIGDLIALYRRELPAAGVDYQQVTTSEPFDRSLLAYLAARGRRR